MVVEQFLLQTQQVVEQIGKQLKLLVLQQLQVKVIL
jgi:hypothetical protein